MYNDRFLLKDTTASRARISTREVPYEGAQDMPLVDIENRGTIAALVEEMLPAPKRRRKWGAHSHGIRANDGNAMETDKTTAYYDERADAFARDTANADVSSILSEFIAILPQGASVLDWGCGTGRDSRAMADAGLAVTSTDASLAMCTKAKELFGIDVRHERFEELATESVYDGIWACASLLHISLADLPDVLQKAKRALRPNGVLYASFKYGNYEGMRGCRWYTDLDEEAIAGLVEKDFETARLWISDDVRPGRRNEKWLNCLLRKRS